MSFKTDYWVATWTTVVTTAGGNANPDTLTKNGRSVSVSSAIPVVGARTISVTADTTPTANTAAEVDINIRASSDDNPSTFDDGATNIYASMNLTDADVKTMSVTPGPSHIKVAVDENASADAAPIVYIVVTWVD